MFYRSKKKKKIQIHFAQRSLSHAFPSYWIERMRSQPITVIDLQLITNLSQPLSHHTTLRMTSGSVLDQALESLLHRLRGLCDNMEPATFTDQSQQKMLQSSNKVDGSITHCFKLAYICPQNTCLQIKNKKNKSWLISSICKL